MKKTLLTFLVVSPFMLFAQQPVKELKVTNANQHAVSAKTIKITDSEAVALTPGESTYNTKNKKAKNYTYVILGETFYDLQTNSSPGRRIVLHADGTVSTVWTTSPDAGSGYPNRGAGYNHNDGSNWLTGRNNKIEEGTKRSGWPSIMLLDDGSERVIAHESSTGGFIMSTNATKGSATFTSKDAILDDVTTNDNRVPIWNRSATSNGNIHIISNYWSSTASNVPVVTRSGVASPTTYSRWNVAGDTAQVEHMILPGYDSTLYEGGGGDSYAIDVRDSIVAILLGGLGDPLSLWKSTDNGETWTYTDVDNLPFKGVRRDAELLLSGDTMDTNDGSVDVMIDASGSVHAFWGLGRVVGGIDDASGDTTFFFFPGQSQLRHWKEGDTEPNFAGSTIDMDQDGALTINQETFTALDANENIPNNLLSAARTGATSLVTMPSASMDDDGNLYVVYSAPIEGVTHFLNANFRDILVSYSTDGGDTWMGPQNITQDRTEECNFPCAAKMANDFLHVMWQQDGTPGTALQNHSASAGTHPNDINRMHYAAIPVTDILNNVIGQNLAGAEEVEKTAEVFVVSQNYPNPFNGSTEATIYLRSGSAVNLTITDILGNVLNSGDLGVMGAGNHKVTIDANGLSSGVYFYTLSTEDHSVTRKMQVK